MSTFTVQPLAAIGSTGNVNGAAITLSDSADKSALEFVVEAAGATPTITYKLQGTFVDSPAATDWFDLILLPSDSETAAVSRTVTAVGRYVSYVSQAHSRFVKNVRLAPSANTNVTYSANLRQHYK